MTVKGLTASRKKLHKTKLERGAVLVKSRHMKENDVLMHVALPADWDVLKEQA